MLLPIGDDNSNVTRPTYITWGLLLLNILVFFGCQGAGMNEDFTYGWSVIPQEIVYGADLTEPVQVEFEGESRSIPQAPGPTPIYLTILSAMFMHGGYMHLLSNLLYLFIFGNNVEHRFGKRVFLLFYLISGVAATLVQVFLNTESVIPNLGASGAISGVLGAYLVLFPRNRIRMLLFVFVLSVPAVAVIGLWIFMQFINGYGAIMQSAATGGIAYGAHIGGFFAGVALALYLKRLLRDERPSPISESVQRDERSLYPDGESDVTAGASSGVDPVSTKHLKEGPWYLLRDDVRYGPISRDQLHRLHARGKLLPTDQLWRQGFMGWQEVRRVFR